jgi:hypothetical protein
VSLRTKSKLGPTYQSPWPLPHPLSPLRVFRIALPATIVVPLAPTSCEGEKIKTHYSGLEIWWLAVKNIGGLDSIFDDSDGAIEESH